MKRPAYAALLVSFVVLIWSSSLALINIVPQWEVSIFRAVQVLPDSLAPLMRFVTLGGTLVAGLIGAALLMIYHRRYGFVALGLVWLAQIVSEIAKFMVDRPRPNILLSDVILRDVVPNNAGFPSSHAAKATVISLVLFMIVQGKWRVVVLLLIPAVGVSRVYLGVHMPLDVVGGVCIGAILYLIFRFAEALNRVNHVDKNARAKT